jgi:hypothetical protein
MKFFVIFVFILISQMTALSADESIMTFAKRKIFIDLNGK